MGCFELKVRSGSIVGLVVLKTSISKPWAFKRLEDWGLSELLGIEAHKANPRLQLIGPGMHVLSLEGLVQASYPKLSCGTYSETFKDRKHFLNFLKQRLKISASSSQAVRFGVPSDLACPFKHGFQAQGNPNNEHARLQFSQSWTPGGFNSSLRTFDPQRPAYP